MASETVNAELVAELWAKQLWVEAETEIWFKKMSGKMEPTMLKADATAFNNIIVIKEELTKEAGEAITIPLAMKLTGSGKTGDDTMDGQEEPTVTYEFKATIDQIRNAVRLKGKMNTRKAAYDMRAQAKGLLKIWLRERMDFEMFEALSNSPTYSATRVDNRHLYAGDATTVATLNDVTDNTGNLFDLRIISEAKRLARIAVPKIRPIYWKGKAYYVCLAHDYQIKACKESTRWKDDYRHAAERGEDNPIFQGADFVFDGVVVHAHENIYTAAIGEELANDTASGDNTATVAVARALFLGAQAGAYVIGERPFWVEDELKDYKNRPGFCTGIIYEAAKTLFNSKDYGTIALDTCIVED